MFEEVEYDCIFRQGQCVTEKSLLGRHVKLGHLYTEAAPRLIQSKSCNVRVLSVPSVGYWNQESLSLKLQN